MRKTAWAKGSSSVPSDRLLPRPSASQPGAGRPGGKQNDRNPRPPKSIEVQKLEEQIEGLRTSALVDPYPKGGCYCRAKVHDLSKITPICMSCGLVLCTVNLPQYSCPYCFEPLLSPLQRDAIVVQLEDDVIATIARETEAREKAIEDARRAIGAFPTLHHSLPGASGSGSATPTVSSARNTPPPSSQQTHKVLSLTGKKNQRVTLSSYTQKPKPAPTEPGTGLGATQEEPERIPEPPVVEPFHASRALDPNRPFENLVGGGGDYVPPRPPPTVASAEHAGAGSKHRRNRGKPKARETENTVPGAAPSAS
ncbi:hypothetical protein FA15DRAFT_752498 [Coprinopsis marcescibilis]|uniref:TRIP4/RQT4 C2HC5-type zinc finger domain-containing protein n=1 Tax=Coprinopsis marcescibilis TaxID=230819 RepID=A0A5C3LLY5_COPMA|nr:hypothetical protein FA15DRAFT_752498 [Coprinopsis marcescibilis]